MKTNCPICDSSLQLAEGLLESEVLECMDCKRKLVVKSIGKNGIKLAEAPAVEEDWGE